MIDPKIREVLNGINATPYGRALQEYLEDEIKELSDLEKLTSWEETLGNKKAIQTLKKLFMFMKIVPSGTKISTYE